MALTWRLLGDWNADEWRQRAACRDSEPNLFFPAGETGPALDQAEAAKDLCRQCPVRGECLAFALGSNQEAGVWGGATEAERRKLRRTWREPPRERLFPSQATPTTRAPAPPQPTGDVQAAELAKSLTRTSHRGGQGACTAGTHNRFLPTDIAPAGEVPGNLKTVGSPEPPWCPTP